MNLFAESGISWPPSAEDFYLADDPARPVMQGDVFDDVPFVKVKRGSKADDPPNVVVERRPVAVLGYTCDIYVNGRLAKVQTVAPVIDAERAGVPSDWDGAFTVAPLPDLRGDDRMHAVDLRVASNVDSFYLDRPRRIRSLSELGWATLRQRIALASGRVLPHLSDYIGAGRDVWEEMNLWHEWNQRGLPEEQFQPWLDSHAPTLSGFTYRHALTRGMAAAVRAALPSIKAAPGTPRPTTDPVIERTTGGH